MTLTIQANDFTWMDHDACDSCGDEDARLYPVEEGVFCGPSHLCRNCIRALTPTRIDKPRKPKAIQEHSPQLAFQFTGILEPTMSTPVHDPKPDINVPPVTVEDPAAFYKEDEPGINCEKCGFWLQPKMHRAFQHWRNKLVFCSDCLERELQIEPFTIDDHLDASNWDEIIVEEVIAQNEQSEAQYE